MNFRHPASDVQYHARANATPDEFVRSRSKFGAANRPQLWDVMMRSLATTATAEPAGNQPEDESDVQDTQLVKRSKTNSERGRAFRARRKKYEDELATLVGSLRQEVADLGFLRSVRADKVLRSRNSMGGSLVRLTREYFSLFERGMPTVRGVGQKRPALLANDGQFESKQQGFLQCAMDPDMQFGDAKGPEPLLDQWRKYTSYHESIFVDVMGVEVSGEEENPLVTVRSDLHVVFSRATFEHVFPHVAHNEELVQRFIGREVVYHGVNRFQFSSKGQILIYDSDVGFVDALVNAGASVSDIALLMQQARIADECRLGEEGDDEGRVQELEQEDEEPTEDNNCDNVLDSDVSSSTPESGGGSDAEETTASAEPSRFAIDFLLS